MQTPRAESSPLRFGCFGKLDEKPFVLNLSCRITPSGIAILHFKRSSGGLAGLRPGHAGVKTKYKNKRIAVIRNAQLNAIPRQHATIELFGKREP